MATLLLQTVGTSIGGAVAGPIGAAVGRALGGLAGNALSRSSKDHIVEGPRLSATRLLTSNEGATIPHVYGQVRLGGEIIWATRFKEVIRTEKTDAGGGKGGGSRPSDVVKKNYLYFVDFAIGLCRGPITGIRRIWADGTELDLTRLEFRLYRGEPDQDADPLITAKQGPENTPAYRDTAYIVFENFPLQVYGNRIPQITVEVIRTVDELGRKIRSVNIIPGATEFGYHPHNVDKTSGFGVTWPGNRNNSVALSDWVASIDELQSVCPNLESVVLVVSWFGTDLRAGECEIRPGVEDNLDLQKRASWSVSGIDPGDAYQVSKTDGGPAYGGTPSDHCVIAAINDLKSRGLKVILYPIILMDIPAGNGLPDPHGAPKQPAYPWRGLVNCFPGIGQPNSADQTSEANVQIDRFCGQAQPADFQLNDVTVIFSGQEEFSFRRQILHYAHLANLAGGVDGMIVGSEMISLSTIRNENNAFPFVDQLVELAEDVRSIVGPQTQLTYAADWTEYFGYQPADGSGDRYFHLDPLWSSTAISYIGIDNYMPLTDLRDDELVEPIGEISVENLRANIAAGEGFDWFYATHQDRLAKNRTVISDGEGEPWIWRYKDLKSWWQNSHHERIGGVRQTNPTGWIPESKPFGFVEVGCPAINRGSNQPNVFVDRKSDQSAIPYFSNGGQDDLVQNRFLKSHLKYWDANDPGFADANNPISTLTGERMVSPENISVWAWDARPFPWFPALADKWSDGENWSQGHWLNGRLTGCPLDSLIEAILNDFGFHDFDCKVDGFLDGFVIPHSGTARRSLEDLFYFFGVIASEVDGRLSIRGRNYVERISLTQDQAVAVEGAPSLERSRSHTTELPREAIVEHGTVFGNYQQIASKTRRIVDGSDRQVTMTLPMVVAPNYAIPIAEARLRDLWTGQNTFKLSVSYRYAALSTGDVIEIDSFPGRFWRIERIETGVSRLLELTEVADFKVTALPHIEFRGKITPIQHYGAPAIALMDLPNLLQGNGDKKIFHLAVYGKPWARNYTAYASATKDGFTARGVANLPAVFGILRSELTAGPEGRWDYANQAVIELYSDALGSVPTEQVLNGANLLGVLCNEGSWELLQFQSAELQPEGTWVISKLLRAQFGTEYPMYAGAVSGSQAVVINDALEPIELNAWETGLELNWLVGPSGDAIGLENFVSTARVHEDIRHKPLSPVHLACRLLEGGDLVCRWVRRSRVDADRWDLPEIPLGEPQERYQVTIKRLGEHLDFVTEVSHAEFVYPAAERFVDFGGETGEFSIEVAQIGEGDRLGYSRQTIVNI